MARYKVIKLIKTGNMFVSDYFIVPRNHRPLAGQEIIVAGINELAKYINNNKGNRYDTSAIKDDIGKYRDYLKQMKGIEKIKNRGEREKIASQLEMEFGREDF